MIVECDNCQTSFNKIKSQILKTKHDFCSQTCMGEFRTYLKETTLNCTCEHCGLEFHKSPGDTTRRFCSRPCRKEGMECSSGKYYYRRFKKDVCSSCGFVPLDRCQLDVHHADLDNSNNEESNLQTLCANCHRYVHRGIKGDD